MTSAQKKHTIKLRETKVCFCAETLHFLGAAKIEEEQPSLAGLRLRGVRKLVLILYISCAEAR